MNVVMVGGQPSTDSVAQITEEACVYPTYGALAVTSRPEEYKKHGHYAVSGVTGTVAFAANAHIAAMRWTDNTSFCFLKRIRLGLAIVTAVTAQAGSDFDVFVHRSFTTSHTTNVTAVSVAGDTAKMAQGMGASNFGAAEIKVSNNTAGGLTGNVSTADASALAVGVLPPNIFTIGGGFPLTAVWDCQQQNQAPLRLGKDEGIVIRNTTLWATGTVKFFVAFEWYESDGV